MCIKENEVEDKLTGRAIARRNISARTCFWSHSTLLTLARQADNGDTDLLYLGTSHSRSLRVGAISLGIVFLGQCEAATDKTKEDVVRVRTIELRRTVPGGASRTLCNSN